jgi:hypothetical protein
LVNFARVLGRDMIASINKIETEELSLTTITHELLSEPRSQAQITFLCGYTERYAPAG